MIYGHEESKWVLGQVQKQLAKLTEWEQGFIANLSERLECGERLSLKQRKVLGNIWDKLGDPKPRRREREA